MRYRAVLNPTEKPKNEVYTREELQQLTTLQLREICRVEKLTIVSTHKLDRDYIIDTILKFRGAALHLYVNTYEEERFNRFLGRFTRFLAYQDGANFAEMPMKLTLYKNVDIAISDGFIVESERLSPGNLVLLDDSLKARGILNLKKMGETLYLTCDHQLLDPTLSGNIIKNFSLGFFDDVGSKALYNFYYGVGNVTQTRINCYYKQIPELSILSMTEASTVLVIDFGTSNSAAGAYRDNVNYSPRMVESGIWSKSINKVTFINNSRKTTESEIIPTVISVQDCSNPEQVRYRYGYDALNYAKKHMYNNPQSIFYGIKKWINNYDKFEEISDEVGRIAVISRKDIIRSYFLNLIKLAEQQHKCIYKRLHITSPIKQKGQFLEMYRAILPEYQVEIKDALDEGISVLYNAISNQIEQHKFEENTDYKALIIDCGGGTTDLTSCGYYIEDNHITYVLNLKTTYANGETNFGGNNVTYRIMQYLKILFAKYYAGEEVVRVEELFGERLADIFRYIDNDGHEAVYQYFEKLYAEAEAVIPTRYTDHKSSASGIFTKVRSNFYFLWNLAERVKIDFYQTSYINSTSFHAHGVKTDPTSRKILAEESWRIYINQYSRKTNHTELELVTAFPEIAITKEEVSLLIRGDIYNVIKKFMEPLYLNDELGDYSYIQLTGQTCKIDIFRDALKEYIPGKVIVSSKKEKSVQDFKLPCLVGTIKYQNAKKIGLIAPTIVNEAPITPYKLIAHSHTGEEKILMSSLQQINSSYGFISRHIGTEEVEIFLQDEEGRNIHKYEIMLNAGSFNDTSYEETEAIYADRLFQDDIDTIVDGEMKVFTFAMEDKWGFYVLPIARAEGVLKIGERRYYPFEHDEWELNFFDGRK